MTDRLLYILGAVAIALIGAATALTALGADAQPAWGALLLVLGGLGVHAGNVAAAKHR